MKASKNVCMTIAIFLMVWYSAHSQENEALSYKAYLSSSISLWERVVKTKAEELEKDPESRDLLYELALAQYGLLNSTMASKDEVTFNKHLDAAKENLEVLINEDKDWAEPKAILSAIYGLQMGYSPWKGMFLGSKSSGMMDKALKQGENSPLVAKLFAGSKLFAPEMFGGDVKEAIKYYERSLKLYEADSTLVQTNWLYIDTMAFLGLAHEKLEQWDEALTVYHKALKREPDFAWVKESLLPRVELKVSGKR